MPKVVDHEAYKIELTSAASKYFSEQGYHGASMRKVAEYLGVSKSALYHYFSSKDELFLACTEFVMARAKQDFSTSEDEPEAVRIEQLIEVMRPDFGSELLLMMDFMRGKAKEAVADDNAMKLALETYYKCITDIVGEARAEAELEALLGKLLLEYMSGKI
jgi:TetR/AcrR family transcriptional regulator, transcriptional repressor of aconitase